MANLIGQKQNNYALMKKKFVRLFKTCFNIRDNFT